MRKLDDQRQTQGVSKQAFACNGAGIEFPPPYCNIPSRFRELERHRFSTNVTCLTVLSSKCNIKLALCY